MCDVYKEVWFDKKQQKKKKELFTNMLKIGFPQRA